MLARPSRRCLLPWQAFAAALVCFAGLYLRHVYIINPRAVYRQAMVKLNTDPGVLEVGL